MKKVFSLWDPLNFVSEKELEFILEDKFEEFKMKLLKELKKQNINIDASSLNVNYKIAKKPKVIFKKETKDEKINQLNLLTQRKKEEMKEQTKEANQFSQPSIQPEVNITFSKELTPRLRNNNELTSFIKNDNGQSEDKETKQINFSSNVKSFEIPNKKQETINTIKNNTLKNNTPGQNLVNEKEHQELKVSKSKHLKLPWELIKKEDLSNNTANNANDNTKDFKGEKGNLENAINKNIYETNETLGFLDLKKIKDKKKEELEEKFKERIRKHYEEFKKDWVEF